MPLARHRICPWYPKRRHRNRVRCGPGRPQGQNPARGIRRSLTPYHVERSKMFALERLGKSPLVDANRIAVAIEMTRFPASVDKTLEIVGLEPKLVQAADLIGQLGDPLYSRNANALFYEFEEIGLNRQFGYSTPADLIDKYPA